jgi:kynurenine formamidase
MRIVDLSLPIRTGMPVYPGDPEVTVAPAATLEADGVNVLSLHAGSHTGTHVDAPFHVRADGARLDELDLGLFHGPVVLAELRGRPPRSPIGWADLAGCAAALRPGAVLVLHTGWSEHFGSPEYLAHPWLTEDAARRVAAAGVRAVAVDALSPDPTPAHGPPETLPAHQALLGAGGVIVENLTNLVALVALVDPVICFLPLPLAGADGAPVRAVAWSAQG